MNRQRLAAFTLILISSIAAAQSAPMQEAATFDADGTAHIKRTIPMPTDISPEAQKWLESLTHIKRGKQTLAERRARTDEWRKFDSAEAKKHYPVNIEQATIAGVRADIITPLALPEANRNRVLINLHGGGFNSDSGSLIEGDPIANLAQTKVVSVYYRLAPENPFPAAVDDVVTVYKELLKTYSPQNIGIFGTSAGATLTCEAAVKLKQLGVPLPAALGVFSGMGDFSHYTDSRQLFALDGLPGEMEPHGPEDGVDNEYVGKTERRDPVLSPLFADWKGMPPALLVTSTRDILLSDTSTLHRAMIHAGVDARLVVFEALPHAFWYHFEFPETREALEIMAKFFDEKVKR
ncbi:MAG TPA: alpha/beta hydrolase [Terriglobales bacterium]